MTITTPKRIPRRLERTLATLTLFISTYPFSTYWARDLDGNNTAIQVMWLVLFGFGWLLALIELPKFLHLITRDKLLLTLLAFVGLSVLWSVAPEVSLRRWIALVLTTGYGAYLALRFSLEEQLDILAWMLGLAVLLSLVTIVVWPSQGITSERVNFGAVRGIYFHKNPFGLHMALAAVVFALRGLSGPRRYKSWAMFGLALLLTIVSRSGTALITLAVTLAAMFCFKYIRQRWRFAFVPTALLAAAGAAVIGILIFLQIAEPVLGIVNKDITLSGRLPTWQLMFDAVAQRPLTGYGYSAFWNGWDSPGGRFVWERLNWNPLHAHNGYMDLWVTIGLVGLSLFAATVVRNAVLAVRLIRSTSTAATYWPLAFLIFISIANSMEGFLVKQNSFMWVLYVMVSYVLVSWRFAAAHSAEAPAQLGTPQPASG